MSESPRIKYSRKQYVKTYAGLAGMVIGAALITTGVVMLIKNNHELVVKSGALAEDYFRLQDSYVTLSEKYLDKLEIIDIITKGIES